MIIFPVCCLLFNVITDKDKTCTQIECRNSKKKALTLVNSRHLRVRTNKYFTDRYVHKHSTEKTLSCENYKPLMIRPDRFMGRCISFAKTVLACA